MHNNMFDLALLQSDAFIYISKAENEENCLHEGMNWKMAFAISFTYL